MMDKKPGGIALVVSEEPMDPKAKALAIARKALKEIAACCGEGEEMGEDDGEEDIDALISKSMD